MLKMTKFRNERGQTMVEFALVLPILLVLLLGIFQFGVAFNNYVTLTDAVRAGARKAAVSRNASNPSADCRAQVLAAKGGLDAAQLSMNLSCTSSWAAGSDVTVTADYPYSISLLNWTVVSGRFSSTMKERVE
jgi:Flp pilus assembly protein TadG